MPDESPVANAIRPSIAPDVQEAMRAQIALYPEFEHTFAGMWDAASRTVTSATYLGFGSRGRTKIFAGDYPSGSIAIHTHPKGTLELSEPDLEALAYLANVHIGFAITRNKCDEILVAREPRAPWVDPSDYRIRKFGRLTLMWKRKKAAPLPNPSITAQQP